MTLPDRATRRPPAIENLWLKRATFRLGLWCLRVFSRDPARRRDREVTPGVLVVQKDARATGATLWVGAFLEGVTADTVPARVVVHGTERADPLDLIRFRLDGERRVSGFRTDNNFYHRHLDVDLAAGTTVEVAVTVEDGRGATHAATTAVTTLVAAPTADGDTVDLLTASCYDVGTDPDSELDALVRGLLAEYGSPDLTVLTGDQVYLDAPWWFSALLARHTPRTYYLRKYWHTWGGEPERAGMRRLLGAGPNWFLPDDHEFWNNWPHASVTAFHSLPKIRQTLRNAIDRARTGAPPPDWDPPPEDPVTPPDDPLRQTYLPVHPNEWEGWGRGAFDLFSSFQSRGRADRADSAAITRGEDVAPIPVGPDGRLEPLNELFQVVDLGPVQVALLDGRTRRTRSHAHPCAQFTDPDALARMLDLAGDPGTEVLVLALAEPVLVAAKYPKQRRWWGLFDHSVDRKTEDYWYQYQRFWHGLVRARDGRPTVVLSGDIHTCRLSHLEELAVVEVVASPMSLVSSPWLLDSSTSLLKKVTKAGGLGPEERPTVAELLAGPGYEGAAPRGRVTRVDSFTHGRAGVAWLRLRRLPEAQEYRLEVAIHPRDRTRPRVHTYWLGAGDQRGLARES